MEFNLDKDFLWTIFAVIFGIFGFSLLILSNAHSFYSQLFIFSDLFPKITFRILKLHDVVFDVKEVRQEIEDIVYVFFRLSEAFDVSLTAWSLKSYEDLPNDTYDGLYCLSVQVINQEEVK